MSINQRCYGCLCKSDNLKIYKIQNVLMKSILQIESIPLCYLCRKLAQKTEVFIQIVQENHKNLENYQCPTNVPQTTYSLHNLNSQKLDGLELLGTNDASVEESFTVITKKNVPVKLEIKEEELLLRLDKADSDGYQDSFIKEDYSLSDFIKNEFENEVNMKCVRKFKKKKVRKKLQHSNTSKNKKKAKFQIETIYLTKMQCMEERLDKSLDKNYLDSTYKCESCIKGFSYIETYEKHMEKHSKDRGDYECDICKHRTHSEEKLLRHKRNHEIRYKCGVCSLTRVCRLTIREHYIANHMNTEYQYVCPHCGKMFERKVTMRKHIYYAHAHTERVICAYCNKSYVNKDGLRKHIDLKHPKEVSAVEVKNQHVCQECGKSFRAPSQLKNHSITHSHTRDYYCVECNKSFKSDSVLKHHLKTAAPHVNYTELPLQCLHCEKRFAVKRDVDRHMNRVHLNIKPFQCDKCERAYVNGWSLTEHKRYVHDGFKRPLKYPCPMCDKVFDRNQILKGHIRTHTGERPYQCPKCPAQFSQASVLGTHIKLIHLKLTRDGRPKAQRT